MLATERVIKLDSQNKFWKKKSDLIGRLKKKDFGTQKGVDAAEEVYSFTPADYGHIQDLSGGDVGLIPETQQGLDAAGNVVDIETLGSGMNSNLCGSKFAGSFAVGKDTYKPTFHTKEIRFPMFCVDEAQVSPKESLAILRTISETGGDLAITMLEYNLWEKVFERSTGNTSIAEEVVFSEDRGLPLGAFPFAPQSHANHEFFKRIQERAMRNPYNYGKKFTVKMSYHQIQRCVEDDQKSRGIDRRSLEKVQDPFRAEEMYMYDGIYYCAKDSAHYVGGVEYANGSRGIVRPHDFVHQAGNVYGTVARTNYELDSGGKINVGGYSFDKFEVAEWYFEESIYFVPFKQNGNPPTSGEERIKDANYNSLTSFKPYWVAPWEITDVDGTKPINDRGQFQQMGMKINFGLFFRPDILSSGCVLMAPVHRNIILVKPDVLLPNERSTPATERFEFREETESILRTNGQVGTVGSTDTSGGGLLLSENPTQGNPDPALASEEAGSFRYAGGGLNLEVIEQTDDEVTVVMRRRGGTQGAASILLTATDGTALAGTNYTATTETLNWADGEKGDLTMVIPLLTEPITENKQFTVVASGATGASAPASDTVTITIKPKP